MDKQELVEKLYNGEPIYDGDSEEAIEAEGGEDEEVDQDQGDEDGVVDAGLDEVDGELDEVDEAEPEEEAGPEKFVVETEDGAEEVDVDTLKSAYRELSVAKKKEAIVTARETTLNTEIETFAALRDEMVDLAVLDKQIKQYEEIDWNALAEEDVAQYLTYERKLRALQSQRAALSNEMSEKHSKLVESEKKRINDTYAAIDAQLSKEVKGWAGGGREALIKYLEKQGFSEMDWSGVKSATMAKLLWKAKQFDEGRASLATKKAAPVIAKVIKPAAPQQKSNGREYLEAKKRLAASGSIDDAVEFLLSSKRR